MEATLSELCGALEEFGIKPVLRGSSDRRIGRVATLEDAVAGEISFLSNPKYERMLQTTHASAVVLRPDIAAPKHLDLVQVEDPYAAIAVLIVRLHGYRTHRRLTRAAGPATIDPTAQIGENATIHPGATVDEHVVIGRNAVLYPGCYVGPRCRIGDDVLLYPNVVLYDDTVLCNRVTVHANSVIGEDGLGYAPVNGRWVKIPQIGHVVIEDDVEIGAGCAIDRATLGRTCIGRGSKFSNLIAIGHGTQIGEHCMLVAQVGVAGSVSVGAHVTMAGQSGVVGHIRIGDYARVGAKAGVTNNVADHETVLGAPAIPIRDMRRQVAYTARLPEMAKRVKQLEKEIAQLRARLGEAAGSIGAE